MSPPAGEHRVGVRVVAAPTGHLASVFVPGPTRRKEHGQGHPVLPAGAAGLGLSWAGVNGDGVFRGGAKLG